MGRERAYVDDDIDESNFKTSEAMNRYKKIFSVQGVTVEREVKFSDFEDLGVPRIFKSRGWLLAMGPSEPANIQIVQEFYANIPPFSAEQKNPPGLGPFGSCLWDETLHFSSGREYPDSFDVYLREIMEVEEENNGNLIPNSHACINPLTSTSDSHPNKKVKKDPLEHAAGEVSKLLQEFLASQMKLQLKGEEALGVVSKIPNLSRLQVFKAVRIILSGNPEEFSLLKSLPDVEKTEWILLLISQSEGKKKV